MKTRLDVFLVEKGYAKTREKAKKLIINKDVLVNGREPQKAGELVFDDCEITIINELPFVSRGGLKLDKGIKVFNIDLKDKICIDVGASTGGFTDCVLKNGAKLVYSVDVGENQLDESLRNDERVVVLEKTNSRYLSKKEIPQKADFLCADVSFISLRLALENVFSLLTEKASALVLIKPQFEAGKEFIGKNGVVKDKKVHKNVIVDICNYMVEKGLTVLGIDFSPVKGQKGNIEYLLYMTKEKCDGIDYIKKSEEIAKKSHKEL